MENEKKEVDLLLNKGFEIETSLFGKPKIWVTKKVVLTRLIRFANVQLKMILDEKALESDDFRDVLAEQFKSVKKNTKNASTLIALSVTNKRWLVPFLAKHFRDNLNSSELLDFAQKLLKQSDYQSFMTSIVLMNGNRITKPETIEKAEG